MADLPLFTLVDKIVLPVISEITKEVASAATMFN
jgi:hypothetical protein